MRDETTDEDETEASGSCSPKPQKKIKRFLSGKTNPKEAAEDKIKNLWTELVNKLNATGGGTVKTVDGWKNAWGAWKSHTKKGKGVSEICTAHRRWPSSTKELSSLENLLMEVINWTSVTDLQSLPEAGIAYKTILWPYFKALVELQENQELHLATKITRRHIDHQNEKMKVKLAVQLFSSSIAGALNYCDEDLNRPQFQESSATANFCFISDKLFDMLNTRKSLSKRQFRKPLVEKNILTITNFFEEVKTHILSLTNLEEHEDYSSDDSINDPNYSPSLNADEENLQQFLQDLESEETTENIENDEILECEFYEFSDVQWNAYVGRHKCFDFIGKSGLQLELPKNISAFDTFMLFFDEEVINLIVTESNIYAEQTIQRTRTSRHNRLNKWHPTNSEEIRRFFGLIMWMGLVRMGNITSYWSNKDIYKNSIAPSIMPRNRFEILLRLLHFSNNENAISGDRLAKIQPLLDLLEAKYKKVFVPEGYTWASKIYSGKSEIYDKNKGLAVKVCEDLSQGLLNEGRTLYVDNFYTSYPLAWDFLRQKTHVVGTVRANKKFMPKEVMDAKLKKGEMIAREDKNGIVVLNWLDTRYVRVLTTKHAPEMVDLNVNSASTSRQKNKQKPLPICEYNKAEIMEELSDSVDSDLDHVSSDDAEEDIDSVSNTLVKMMSINEKRNHVNNTMNILLKQLAYMYIQKDKVFTLLSTLHNNDKIDNNNAKKKTDIILIYNATKEGVDTEDQTAHWYSTKIMTRN
ncbi:hypothetical protein CBL_12326 [Carabus blaptoides fortunei]